jgi:tetratricopeptide (TPR) repeat protein
MDFEDISTEPQTAEQSPTLPAEATDKLSQEDKEEVDRLIREGVTAMTAGDMRLCILSLEEASILAPEHPALLYYYGMAYDKLQNPRKAREFYTRVFQMRDKAGSYFERAARRITYGAEQPAAMRGKLSFGQHQVKHSYSPDTGEQVDMLLPVLLAPGEEVRPDDIYITIQFFDLVSGRRIEFSRMATPQLTWQKENPDWSNWEENLVASYSVPPLTQEQLNAYGDLRYYGFTAKLYYKGEPLDCISSPSALILQEQVLNSRQRRRQYTPTNSLLPDDGLVPDYEEAMPVSEFLPELPLPE